MEYPKVRRDEAYCEELHGVKVSSAGSWRMFLFCHFSVRDRCRITKCRHTTFSGTSGNYRSIVIIRLAKFSIFLNCVLIHTWT